jgi:hypothetical protein
LNADDPELWIIFLSAFGGGLLGAVLQPLVGHFLEIFRSDRSFRKRRQQELRRMLRGKMGWGRRVMAVAKDACLMQEYGRTVPVLDRLQKLTEARPDYDLWEPESIRDDKLRGLALEYDRQSAFLWREATEQNVNRQLIDDLVDSLISLQRKISQRMDDLVWPVDERL